MKLTTLTAVAIVLSVSAAFAAEPTGPVGQNGVATPHPSSSGRPSAILNDSQCQNVWQEAIKQTSNGNATSGANNTATNSQNNNAMSSQSDNGKSSNDDSGKSLSENDASPYISNFALVDKDKNGQISQSEFQKGCANGWVQAAAGSDKLNMESNPNARADKSGG